MNERYKDASLPINERIEDLLPRMTLGEKVAQMCMMRGVEYAKKPSPKHPCCVESDTEFDTERLFGTFGTDGIGFVHDMYSTPETFNRMQRILLETQRLPIPAIFTAEALHGVSGLRGTIFPCPINLGATFDPALVKEVGEAIGRETRALGMHEILAPNLDVAREPRWGRIEETFGEDTFLSSRMAAAIVSGEQKGDVSRPDAVVSEPKHYCVHGIAEGGTNCSPARAGRREVDGCYLPVFEAGITEGGAYNVMVSYNSIDGDPMMCSSYYLNDVLRDRLHLKGYTRSDWGGIGKLKRDHHVVSTDKDAICLAVTHGLDVQGCDYEPDFFKQTVMELVDEGRISLARIDEIVRRVLFVKFSLGLFEHPYTDEKAYESVVHCEEHRKISHRAALSSAVLLKNNGVLPLDREKITSIAVVGPSSNAQKIGGYSSLPQFHISSVYEELRDMMSEQVRIVQCDGCGITEEAKQERIVEGQAHLYEAADTAVEENLERAVSLASSCDVIVAVCGDNTVTSGEGRDRCELTLSGKQRELIRRLSALKKPLVLVLENGKPLEISKESEWCDAVLMSFFGGETGGRAIAEILLGHYNPSGRLPISLPRHSTRIPCYYSMLPGGDPMFFEGEKNALYPFGYGLSYTTFEYSALDIAPQPNGDVLVSCDVENTGDMDGEEVVQVYVDDVDSSVVTPPMLLKGFTRVALCAHEKQRVTVCLPKVSFSLIDVHYQRVIEPGRFRILVGKNQREILLSADYVVDEQN
ncbi:glycoside hydrolase family 3 C-terminal domain-containing protein [Phocea massiliensis]|uniref:Glycoside hydrolase family 3 C-terminal domain-containing protein n=1 Tax=Merdimmobilis hominis TaxID=2897707 RepID=A0A938X7U3_9FIRM|nr:glycoside hydrolase family 3 N-terminal domain-containing protein [Merdimmobilis hominis]MBM6921796.1 glycoside hydrolase family 3 C-terminal domain-containing protein [Merdimmobilis hominis]